MSTPEVPHISGSVVFLNVTLPYPPSANRYWRVMNGHVVKSAEARRYQDAVRLSLRQTVSEYIEPICGPVKVTLWVYRPRKSGDLDNRAKVTLDSLQGCAYGNDDQIVELHAYRMDDKDNPRIEVRVEAIRHDTHGLPDPDTAVVLPAGGVPADMPARAGGAGRVRPRRAGG